MLRIVSIVMFTSCQLLAFVIFFAKKTSFSAERKHAETQRGYTGLVVSVSYSGMRLKQKGRGFDPHSGRRVVSLSKIGLGSTHFMTLIRVNKGLSTH